VHGRKSHSGDWYLSSENRTGTQEGSEIRAKGMCLRVKESLDWSTLELSFLETPIRMPWFYLNFTGFGGDYKAK
jgi:hypothetical protein